MKVSKYINRISEVIKYGDEKSQLKLIFLIATVNITAILMLYGITGSSDTPGYFSAGEIFLNGGIDVLRTPVYPLICAVAKRYSVYHDWIIVVFQTVMFLISILYFYWTTLFFIHRKRLVFAVTAIYAGFPYFASWILSILTESLALSLFIIFSYYILHFLRDYDIKSSVVSNLLFIILLMLRPAFICILPALLLIHIYMFYKRRRNCWINTIGLLVVSGVFLSYSFAFKHKYGVFATSSVGYINQIEILRQLRIIDASHCEAILDKYRNIPSAMDSVIHKEMENNKLQYAIMNCAKVIYVCNENCYYMHTWNSRIALLNSYLNIFGVSIFFLYILIIVYAWIILKEWRRNSFPILNIYLWLCITGFVFTSIWGAYGDYSRLFLPCTPFILINIFQLVDKVNISKNNNTRFI